MEMKRILYVTEPQIRLSNVLTVLKEALVECLALEQYTAYNFSNICYGELKNRLTLP